jgi:hypothetical protein
VGSYIEALAILTESFLVLPQCYEANVGYFSSLCKQLVKIRYSHGEAKRERRYNCYSFLTSAYNEAAMCELLPPVFPTENV